MNLKKIFSKIALGLPAFLTACSGSTTDVRLTLCKDLTLALQQAPESFEWQSEVMKINGYEDLQVQLSYLIDGHQQTAVCFYAYEAVDENAMTLSDPASAFSTYPNKMLINDETVNHQTLAKNVNRVMLKQGKKLF